MRKPRVLILMVKHGAAHERVATALRKALLESERSAKVEVVDALACCAPWFRTYYNAYEVPLRYSPGVWGWIESIQHTSKSTGPRWLYERGLGPLCRMLQEFEPDIVVATEVGLCELAAMAKRRVRAEFHLIAAPVGTDVDPAWVQPEVNLYVVAPGDIAAQLEIAGAPPHDIICCGTPIDSGFASLPDRITARKRLNVSNDLPLLIVLFGGTGFGRPHRIVPELRKVRLPLHVILIAGRSRPLQKALELSCAGSPEFRVLGWVENMHEWMAAADLLISKPGAATVVEALACGLPLLAFDPLPGCERRTCFWIEEQRVGYWIRSAEQVSFIIERLLTRRQELDGLRERALILRRPRAAYDAAGAIIEYWRSFASLQITTS